MSIYLCTSLSCYALFPCSVNICHDCLSHTRFLMSVTWVSHGPACWERQLPPLSTACFSWLFMSCTFHLQGHMCVVEFPTPPRSKDVVCFLTQSSCGSSPCVRNVCLLVCLFIIPQLKDTIDVSFGLTYFHLEHGEMNRSLLNEWYCLLRE